MHAASSNVRPSAPACVRSGRPVGDAASASASVTPRAAVQSVCASSNDTTVENNEVLLLALLRWPCGTAARSSPIEQRKLFCGEGVHGGPAGVARASSCVTIRKLSSSATWACASRTTCSDTPRWPWTPRSVSSRRWRRRQRALQPGPGSSPGMDAMLQRKLDYLANCPQLTHCHFEDEACACAQANPVAGSRYRSSDPLGPCSDAAAYRPAAFDLEACFNLAAAMPSGVFNHRLLLRWRCARCCQLTQQIACTDYPVRRLPAAARIAPHYATDPCASSMARLACCPALRRGTAVPAASIHMVWLFGTTSHADPV